MNVNLPLCLNAPRSMAADVQGALLHPETAWPCHLALASSSLVQEQPTISREVSGCWT